MRPELRRACIVGGNSVSAFLSWRLQATNACDVTLVWKANYQAVAQYGISFKSEKFGNERFKPRYVVSSPEEAASAKAAFDYVLLCVKALPDVYNLADIIQSVVTPQHTCVIVNTTNTLGVEKELEQRFPTNVVLSLVSGAELAQLGPSEFEHTGPTDIWVGPANHNAAIPDAIQRDMSEALAMTLATAEVDCKVSSNIRQQQYERMIGPIAFYPASVLFETPNLGELIKMPGVHELVNDVMAELITLASASNCSFPADFAQRTIAYMTTGPKEPSTMYQDFLARRPMEVETYLGSPVALARSAQIKLPRIDTLYSLMRHVNSMNKDRPAPSQAPADVAHSALPPRTASMQGLPRPIGPPFGMNGVRGPRGPMGPPGRRGPPPVNGFRSPPNSYPPNQSQLRASFDEHNLEEFNHITLYDDLPDGDATAAYGEAGPQPNATVLRERELALRERELHLKQQEMAMRRGGGRRILPSRQPEFDDSDGEDDFFDPMALNGRPPLPLDPDMDMMSVTSRRTRRAPSQNQLRRDIHSGMPMARPGSFNRVHTGRNRSSAQLMASMPMTGEDLLNNPMMSLSSNRYGAVDRKELHDESRTNSLTAARLHEMGGGPGNGPYPVPPNRRTSRSPGNPLGPPPMARGGNRPSPPNEAYAPNGRPNGRPSPPGANDLSTMASANRYFTAGYDEFPLLSMDSSKYHALAQLNAHLADTENIMRMTAEQADQMRFLGAYVGALFMGSAKVLGEESVAGRSN
ncbi:hypothetical protein DV737_g3655, partial [Chaetothyriales sp. CBS 132003]